MTAAQQDRTTSTRYGGQAAAASRADEGAGITRHNELPVFVDQSLNAATNVLDDVVPGSRRLVLIVVTDAFHTSASTRCGWVEARTNLPLQQVPIFGASVLERLSSRMHAYPGVTSVLVASSPQQYEWYDEPHGDGVLRNTRSVTKTVTGMLVGAAIDRGLIRSVGDEIAWYLGDRSSRDPRLPMAVTIEQLLTMSSPLDCSDDDPASPGNEEQMYPAPDWLAFARSIPLRRTGGPASFQYCTAHTVLLGAAVEAASGMELSAFADHVLFEPLGITDKTWFRSTSGSAFPGGGLELRSRDLLALGELYLCRGMWQGSAVISREWVESSTKAHVRVDDATSYGYLWWLRSYPSPRGEVASWLMLGNGGSKVAVFPQLGTVVVITATNYGKRGMHELTDRLVREEVLSDLTGS